ncbi:glycoside hydrolase family 3 C-terminal domain-containing protein [Phycicoccus sp. BSK3Z-2]|uniref:Exo-alpha-(1->6)-L-arabinopyranosidase n=1 Tax=Phycicoccus avicenniae TaxID=2828860 RepID=A0A941HXE3_9MICO|nr:glycoside hydrolase family 3 C-terminal domain-containing protein [Phycicoccus avicenniae]MBR7741758.1 glycoside hydrolase family 3 C-terminal domain-containing protein [Phycicoccus avicenniae]
MSARTAGGVPGGGDLDAWVADVLGRLTVRQKAALTIGGDFWHTAAFESPEVPAVTMADGPHGLRVQPRSEDQGGYTGSLPSTCFPTASALASSFDVGLLEEVGRALGREADDLGVHVLLGPGVNIKRSPLCGRNFEYFSEDPYVAGVLGSALVRGIQENGTGACVKHYAANNQETDRLRVSAEVDERTLREIYLPAFERVVREASPAMVMCAYNRVNGEFASQHHWLLTEVLREEWGFDGVVVSDWGAVHDRVAALAAGLDLEMPPNLGHSELAVEAAVRSGALDPADLDRTVERILRLVGARAGRSADADTPERSARLDRHHRLARVAAARSAVLLRNDGDLLPLELAAGATVAVVGPFAVEPRYQGAGSSRVNATRTDGSLEALRAGVPPGVRVEYAEGFVTDSEEGREDLVREAVALAAKADVAVVHLGLPSHAESEGFDRTHLDLPGNQVALLAALREVCDRVVVVLMNGSVVRTAPWESHADAVLEMWLGGQAVGGAVADLLLGVASPGGRLPESIPLALSDTTSFVGFPGEEGRVHYGEGVMVGYRGLDLTGREVSYPFGHGLAYTTFTHEDLEVTTSGSVDGGDLALDVRCTVRNTGPRAGREVVQVYVGDPEASVARPPRELRAFVAVDLEPGESAPVHVRLTSRDLAFWSTVVDDWVVEAGTFVVEVGASSRDIRLEARVVLEATPRRRPLSTMSTLCEWLEDPRGRPLLLAMIGAGEDGRPGGILGDDEHLSVIGNFPLESLATFPGTGVTNASLRGLLADLGRDGGEG